MSVEILQEAAYALISLDAAIECIATGSVFTEGAISDPRDQSLLFKTSSARTSAP